MTFSNDALAACANPAGVKGEIIYNDDFDMLQFCDDTDWIGMSGGTGGGGAGVTDGDKGDITVSGSGASWMIDDDVLDFTEFSDAMTLDASTTITITGSNTLSLINTGTGDSFVVMDQASDTTPFVIDAAGNVGIGLAAPTQALDVVGTVTPNSLLMKKVAGAAAPTGGSGGSGNWTTDGTHVWRATGRVGIGVTSPATALDLGAQATGDFLTLRDTNGLATADEIGLRFKSTTNDVARIHTIYDGAAGNALAFSTTQTTTGTLTERLRLTGSGNVGIGITSPTHPLTVDGTAQGSNDSAIVAYRSQSSHDAFSITPSGGVTYLGNGLHFLNDVWVHDGSGATNALLAFGGGGAVWFASNNSAASWNVASSITLWNGSGVLVGASSRSFKEGFKGINKADVLDRISTLDIEQWKYKSEPGDIQHIGPVAEDWHATFGTGDSDKYIPLTDGIGVALVGVQALKEENDILKAMILDMKAEIRALRAVQE